MAKEYLDKDGVLYFWQKIKTWVAGKIPTKVSQLANDSGFTTNTGTITGVSVNGSSVATSGTANVTVPTPASATPKMDGTAAVGTETKWAKGDHVHPTDTSRAAASDLTSHTGNSTIHVTAAERTKWNAKQDVLTFDTTPTADSTNPVTSGGIKDALAEKVDTGSSSYMKDAEDNGDGTISLIRGSGSYAADVLASSAIGSTVAPLQDGFIPSKYLPSYVDDVIEAYPVSSATALASGWLSASSGGSALTPETGKIYILMAASGDYTANSQFRWSGSTYVKLADGGVSSITNAEIDTIIAS